MKIYKKLVICALFAPFITNDAFSQSIGHVKDLLEQLQKEVEFLEKEQAETIKLKKSSNNPVEPTKYCVNDVIAVDTLPTGNDAIKVVLFNDNTWRYMRSSDYVKDNEIFKKYWDNSKLFPYKEFNLASLPNSIAIDLVDSLGAYHYPYKAPVYSKYGVRHRRQHQGVDLCLKMGDPVYATFNGKVRISEYNTGGYGNLVVIRHENGLETYYGHLSERIVSANDWVEAGQIIGYGGSTGRSTGPHLHYETRYMGQTFDPERLIDFKSGVLRRETILLKKSYFSIYSKAEQDFDVEIDSENDSNSNSSVEKEAEKPKPKVTRNNDTKYHKVVAGDNLGRIAAKYHTTIDDLCKLNKIKRTTTINIGQRLRVN